MTDHSAAPLLQLAPSKASSSGRVDRDKADVDGVGKFKLTTARGGRHKDKFHALREHYDHVTARHEELQRELEVSNEKLRRLHAENDLLLDAMHIVAHQQPSLAQHLPQAEPEDPVLIGRSGNLREEYVYGNQIRMNGDSDRHFENSAQHPDYSMHEANGHIP